MAVIKIKLRDEDMIKTKNLLKRFKPDKRKPLVVPRAYTKPLLGDV